MIIPSRTHTFNILTKYTSSLDKVGNARIGAIITYKREIVAFGHNRYKTHPLQQRYNTNNKSIYLHAEIDVIQRELKNEIELDKCCLWICRLKQISQKNKSLILGLAKPCAHCCQPTIVAFGIRHVVYSTNEGTWRLL